MPDLHLSQLQIGWLNAAFATCYTLAQIPGGVLGQRYGARLMYTVIGLVGLLSGMLSATAYLQVTALGRAGEPESRIVCYFSLGGVAAGALSMLWTGITPHRTLEGPASLLAVGLLASIAQLLMTRAYGTGRTLVVASLQYLGIAFAFLYGVLLFGDRVTWMALAGMGLIVGAGLGASLLRSQAAPPDARQSTLES